MSGSATAAAGQNFIPPNPPLQQPSPSPAATPNDQFAVTNSTARGQFNAWGWPSGFNQPSPSPNAAGPSRTPSFSGAPAPSPALASATMFTPQAQQLNHQHQHQQHQQTQLQLQHLQHPHPQQQHQHQHVQHQPPQQHPQQPQHLQHHLGTQQQQQQQPQQQQHPHLQLQQPHQQPQGPQTANSQAKAAAYPPQPYGNPPAFTAPNQTSSPNSAAKPNTPNSHSVVMSKKRTASKSPEFESKDKRSRPEEGVSGDDKGVDTNLNHSGSGSNARVWGEEATKLDVYVWDYLSRRGFNSAAKALMNEAGMTEPPEVPLKTPQGLLFEYWAIFWDVFAARSGRGGSEAAAYFEYQESRNMQRLAEATRKTEALEAQYQPPDNGSHFPNIVVTGLNADPNAAGAAPAGAAAGGPNGRAAAPGVWNPAALPQAQQQQLLITAAQRQNIPLHEVKNLTPASRMALINSMNPNNPANAQAVRPGMNNQLMEQQLQARLQQQQAIHRMMQQQRQAGGPGPMPNHAGVPGAPPMANAMQVRPPMGPQQMAGAGGSPAPPTPGGTMDGRRSVGPGAEANRDHLVGAPGVLAAGNMHSQPQQPPTPGVPHQAQPQQQQPGAQPQTGQAPQQQHPQLNPHQQQMVMNQFQSVQAAMREEWMKAQNAPNQTTAADFYANVQAYQAKAQGLQSLLRAQANYQGGAGMGAPGNGAQPGMPGQPAPSPQVRPPVMGGLPGPAPGGSPASMANLTPQQRAAQIANAQAAAGRITPLMATHDPGLMASMMGPNSMPNGTGSRPNQPNQAQSGPGQQQQQQQPQAQAQGPARPSSAQGGAEDAHGSHFSSVQMGSSPSGMQRPTIQRASSQLGNNAGGMGPPGGAAISSQSPRISATNLQQQQSGTNANQGQAQAGSPAPSNVPNTPNLGSAEKGKKGNARQRKNSKATTKTPVLSAASVPSSNANATASAPATSNGAAGPSTPAAANAVTPASASAATPGRDAASKPDNVAGSASNPQPTSHPIDTAMPPPTGLPANTSDSNSFSTAGPNNGADNNGSSTTTNGPPGLDGSGGGGGGGSGADGSSAGAGGGGGAEDFSMFGFGGSMNDIFDFDLSTDGTAAQGLSGDGWDGNFGNLFGSGTGGQDGS